MREHFNPLKQDTPQHLPPPRTAKRLKRRPHTENLTHNTHLQDFHAWGVPMGNASSHKFRDTTPLRRSHQNYIFFLIKTKVIQLLIKNKKLTDHIELTPKVSKGRYWLLWMREVKSKSKLRGESPPCRGKWLLSVATRAARCNENKSQHRLNHEDKPSRHSVATPSLSSIGRICLQ
jgi:hypothetical protein